ncbi:anti-sigma factor family protein [Lentibacillus sediminis]|uniref:anti-sigma factor family protein n=1 Tax=Lentibacillus sediminis TaxID=1940529 RepID=UPI000C1C78B6|nr:anti-sigma factor [Lentibacillus sediminis]
MNCNHEATELMHKYLDGDLTAKEESEFRRHLEDCEACQEHFRELKRTITLLQSGEHVEAPPNFTQQVMQKLPAEKKQLKYKRWMKAHPMFTAAAIFFILMMGSVMPNWNQDSQLVVSKQEDLIIQGGTVIVPSDVTVEDDLLVKNGNLIIEGTVDGNVTIINGELIDGDEPIDSEGLMASVGEINGELHTIDQAFEKIWYHIKSFFQGILDFAG